MTIENKYKGWSEIFWRDFVVSGTANAKGTNIPAQQLDYDSKTVLIGDGTVNMADLLQLQYVRYLLGEVTKKEISPILSSLSRLSRTARTLYATMPGLPSREEFDGFFMRDDVPVDGWGEEWKVTGGYAGWMTYDDDPCYSPFVSQDQVWNLSPILMALADEGMERARKIGLAINSYIKDNGYTVYNPYLSWILHYHKYLPSMNESKVKPWERKEDRDNHFMLTEKVKRGANNWYYSGGTSANVDMFEGKGRYRHTLRTFLYRMAICFLDRIWHTKVMFHLGVKVKKDPYYCYAATSGIWYAGNFKRRLAKLFNRALEDEEPFGMNLAFLACDPEDIDWNKVREWLEGYPDPTEKGVVKSPIRFLYAYEWITYENS